jgi:hypothetical protein
MEFHLADSVDKVNVVAGSTVFIIGDPFKVFRRLPDVTYVFLNFSVLTMTRSPFLFGLSAYKLLSKKRKILESKMDCFDWVLDYWPEQTSILKTKFERYGKHVDYFPVGLNPVQADQLAPLSKRKYDVCFVGALTSRREKILNKLKAMGISLSPSNGIDFEDAARDSRIVLNLHAHRSNHLESPRMLGAFATKAALVTEDCPSLSNAFPPDTYVTSRYRDLASRIKDLLEKPEQMDRVATVGYDWLKNGHVSDCEQKWAAIVKKLEMRQH